MDQVCVCVRKVCSYDVCSMYVRMYVGVDAWMGMPKWIRCVCVCVCKVCSYVLVCMYVACVHACM